MKLNTRPQKVNEEEYGLRARRGGVAIDTRASGGTRRASWEKWLKRETTARGIERTVSVVFVFVVDPIAVPGRQYEPSRLKCMGKRGIATDPSCHGHLCETVVIAKKKLCQLESN